MNIPSLRTISFTDMMAELGEMVEKARFEAGPDENEATLQERLKRTLDKAPPLYAFLLEANSYLAYWVAMASNIEGGIKGARYLDLREKRDAVERLSKSTKLFYDAASRRITIMQMGSEQESRQK